MISILLVIASLVAPSPTFRESELDTIYLEWEAVESKNFGYYEITSTDKNYNSNTCTEKKNRVRLHKLVSKYGYGRPYIGGRYTVQIKAVSKFGIRSEPIQIKFIMKFDKPPTPSWVKFVKKTIPPPSKP